MLGHLKKDLLHDAQSLSVRCVNNEKDAIDVWIEEAPALSVATLTRHIVHNALLARKRQCDLFYVNIRRGFIELS